MWGVWGCLILKDWSCTGCGVGCVGLFDTEGLVLYRRQDVVWGVWGCLILKDWCCTGLQDVVWGVWDCLILKDWCCTGCGVGCVGLFDTEGLVLYRMWCGVCGAV